MKRKNLWIVVTLVFVSAFVSVEVRGIPTNVGNQGFINPAGMRLEDFVARKAMWQPQAELKGDWEFWKDKSVTDPTIQLMHLTMPALVFGVPASEVTVQKRDDTHLQFRVVFEPYDKIKEFGKLKNTVIRNASLWSGNSATDNPMKQDAAVYSFKADEEAERIVVTITPK